MRRKRRAILAATLVFVSVFMGLIWRASPKASAKTVYVSERPRPAIMAEGHIVFFRLYSGKNEEENVRGNVGYFLEAIADYEKAHGVKAVSLSPDEYFPPNQHMDSNPAPLARPDQVSGMWVVFDKVPR